ncbi:endonuclease/exonuclease/phosphatase family protein [Nonomuraea angiospora]|uniref:Endonuclease/exonuclease/phosphatase domain-containing protein n=1 Tax=Nonomuraea angiospora TaxID=46172 RepID=A0ABR9M5S8_9ACTN|nr:hypothetical protein [Nonomuraea angiospora]MBE1588248.1 hypothetical protein [Nonomuraea angiospora]
MATITVMSQNAQYAARAQGRWPRLAEVVRQIQPTILLLQEVDELADPDVAGQAAAEHRRALAGPGPDRGRGREGRQYAAAVEAFAASNTVILALADELAAGTVNKTLAKPDLELGVETLAGALARQANPFPDASLVRVRHPLTAGDTDETSWPWLTGLVVGWPHRASGTSW